MTETESDINPSQRSENIVRTYFETRPGWSITKLDLSNEEAADFLVCHGQDCFLLEVKTISSVHANYPYKPLIYHNEQRQKRKGDIEEWLSKHPDRRIVMPPDEWEYVFGDETRFVNRYRYNPRFTQNAFERFKERMRSYFGSSRIQTLPYRVRLDSDDLYVPNSVEIEKFFTWLEAEIQAIHTGAPGWHWHTDPIPGTQIATYSAFYPIHEPTNEHDIKAHYQLTVEGPLNLENLELSIFSYGSLNLDAITNNVEKAVSQLKSSAERKSDRAIPRGIALAFEGGLGFEWNELSSHIAWLFEQYPDLSAIAVLDRAPEGTPPPSEDGFFAWVNFLRTATWKDRFVVFHNTKSLMVRPLPRIAFEDDLSQQIPPEAV